MLIDKEYIMYYINDQQSHDYWIADHFNEYQSVKIMQTNKCTIQVSPITE